MVRPEATRLFDFKEFLLVFRDCNFSVEVSTLKNTGVGHARDQAIQFFLVLPFSFDRSGKSGVRHQTSNRNPSLAGERKRKKRKVSKVKLQIGVNGRNSMY
jgi:hypothetical protein